MDGSIDYIDTKTRHFERVFEANYRELPEFADELKAIHREFVGDAGR